ncbi:MAG: PAS domain S-box protein [bacterium]|nr:PAS domain S-box protein [bacterium]
MEPIFDLVMDSADGVFGVDNDQQVVFWNRSAEYGLGLTAREVLGRPCYDVLGGRSGDLCLKCKRDCATIRMARNGQNVPARDLRIELSGGREVWLSLSTILVPSRWRHLSVLIHVFHEISRQKEIERSVMALLRRLEHWVERMPPNASDSSDQPPAPEELTERERDVLELLASGASTENVADMLSISPATVRNHVHHILVKLGVHTRLEAVTFGLKNDLIPKRW